jgi:hypothetical protein
LPRNTPAGACSGALLAALLAVLPATAQETPYAATSRGAACNLDASGSLHCTYRVGRDLEFSLQRVTVPEVTLVIARSDAQGDYYVEPTLVSRCALVRYGQRSFAVSGSNYVFAAVSGRNGLVYRTLRECRLAR